MNKISFKNNHFSQLDGLRGISIIFVMLNHLIGDQSLYINFIRSRGHVGVDIFFAISGFLVTKSLFESFGKHEKAIDASKEFFLKRITRIFIPYYITIIFIFTLSFFINSLNEKIFKLGNHLYSFLLYFYNYQFQYINVDVPGVLNITWSLCFEEQFYLLLFILSLLFRKRISLILTSILIFSIVIKFINIFYYQPTHYDLIMLPHLRAEAIIFGSLFFIFNQKILKTSIMPILTKIILPVSLVAIYLSVKKMSLVELGINHTMNSIIFASLVFYLANFKDIITSLIFDNIIIRNIGIVSYELYLVHQIANGFIHKLNFSNTIYITLYFASSYLIAYIFYKAVSNPSMIYLRKKFI